MGAVFERFTDQARQVVVFAIDEARTHGHNNVGTEAPARSSEDVRSTPLTCVRAGGSSVRKSLPSSSTPRSSERVIRPPRLTARARWVFIVAEDEARRLGHDYIGTEHVLLGLIREGQGIAARVLESRNIRQDEVRAHVRRIVGEGPGQTSDRFPLALQAKKALQFATREAVERRHGWIGTEHILLGVVREDDSVGARILADLGSPPGAVAADVRAMLDATK